MIRFLLKSCFFIFVVIALGFVLLHHPQVHRWARNHRFLHPFAEAFHLSQNQRPKPSPTARHNAAVTTSSESGTTKTKSRIPTSVRVPQTEIVRDHLTKEDQDALVQELERLGGAPQKKRVASP